MNEDGFGYNNNSSMRARITDSLSSTRSSCECLKSNLWLIPNTNPLHWICTTVTPILIFNWWQRSLASRKQFISPISPFLNGLRRFNYRCFEKRVSLNFNKIQFTSFSFYISWSIASDSRQPFSNFAFQKFRALLFLQMFQRNFQINNCVSVSRNYHAKLG